MSPFQSKKNIVKILLNLSDENNLKQTHIQNSSKGKMKFYYELLQKK